MLAPTSTIWSASLDPVWIAGAFALGWHVGPEVLVPATTQFGLAVGLGMALLIGLGALGLPIITELDRRGALLVAFGLAFSSRVLAVKVLERRRESAALHGRVAIGILIIQGVIVVLFLAFSKGALPSLWALLLIPGLLPAQPALYRLLDRSGRGELLTLLGLALAVGAGASAFDALGLKADLGALTLGLLMGRHPRSEKLGVAEPAQLLIGGRPGVRGTRLRGAGAGPRLRGRRRRRDWVKPTPAPT